MCEYAYSNGHLEVLKYLHENGGPWDEDCCVHASVNGLFRFNSTQKEICVTQGTNK